MATNIIGRGVGGLLKYAKIKWGEEGLKKVLDSLSKEDRAIFDKKIDPLEWYPFSTYVNVLVVIDKVFGKGDLSVCKDIGIWSAERDLAAVFNLYTKGIFKNPSTLKTAPHVMWTNYYSKGDMVFSEIPTVIDIPEVKATARIIDFPDAAKPNCRLLEGWIQSVFQHVVEDARIFTATEIKCRVDGDEYCEYLGVLKRKGA